MICPGGYCEMCPQTIQRECEMTPRDRVEHIRQCVRLMRPTMGFELAGAAAIELDCQALDQVFTRLEGLLAEIQRQAMDFPPCG